MKNTMQNYCFSAILPNILLKKSLKHRIFRCFVIYRLQNRVFLTIINKYSNCFKEERKDQKKGGITPWGTRLIGRDDYRDELLKTTRLIGRNAYRVNY